MTNLKGTLSSLAGLLIALAGAIVVAIQTGVVTFFPSWAESVCALLVLLAGAFIGWAQGKNPNLTNKTARQVDNINNEHASTKNLSK